MKTLTAASLALMLFPAAAYAQSTTVKFALRAPRTLADGCVATTLSCGTTGSGQLAPGDCSFSDGTRYDVWRFSGNAGQLVRLTLQPLDASYTAPVLELVPPAGDASKTPIVLGRAPLTISYALASTGTWSVFVGTEKLVDAGRYSLSLQCSTASSSSPQNCVAQTLTCEQRYDWWTTASSCQFSDGTNVYAPFEMRLAKNDYVHFFAQSDDYDPGVGVYRGGGASLAFNYGKRFSQEASVYFTAPETATYLVVVNGAPPAAAGEFYMGVTCINVCQPPSVTRQPASQTVPYGGTASFSVEGSASNGNAPTCTWYEDNFSLPVSIGSGSTLVVPNVTTSRRFYATIENACGSQTSATATVTPLAPPRGRAVHH